MSALNLSLAANTVDNSNKCFLVTCCERWKQLSLKACNDPLFICAAIDWWSNQDIACLLLYDSWDGLQPPCHLKMDAAKQKDHSKQIEDLIPKGGAMYMSYIGIWDFCHIAQPYNSHQNP